MELKTYFAQDAAGNIISSAIVNVFLQGTTTLATGLTRADGTPLENPFAADGAGRIQFRAPDGYYDIQVSAGSGIIQTLTIQCVDYTGVKGDADRAEAAADRADVSAEQVEDAIALRGDLVAQDGAELIGVGSKITAAPALNLKEWLNDEVVNLRTRFGLSSSATPRQNTDNLQAAYDELSNSGGGRMRMPSSPAPYYFAPSVLTESYDNYGVATYATEACVIARPKVLLIGDGVGVTLFQVEEGNVATSCFFALSPSGGGFQHMSIRGNGSSGGNSHGIINLNISQDPVHLICENWLLDHLEVSNLGSYGIGIDNGDITNLRASNIYIRNVGADGIDTKQRGPHTKNIGMNFSNIVVDGFGLRLTGSAGLDFHGLGQVTNLTVRNMGLTGQTGFRMRTLTADGAEGENARMSKATNIVIENAPANNNHAGILIGSPDCIIQGAVARGVTDGFQIAGNSVGAPNRTIITDAHAIDCAQYGYLIGTGVDAVTLNNAYAINCNVGFRNQGTKTTYIRAVPISCTTNFSSATVSAPTERSIGSDTYGMSENTTGTNRITMEPRAEVADVEVALKPKGTSRLALMDGAGNRKIQIDQNGVGFHGGAPAGRATLNAAATDAATTTALVNQIRTALITNGLAQ